MQKKPKKIDMNPKQLRYELQQAYRRLTWKIWVYLKANPDVLEANNNREIFDEMGKIQTQIFMRRYPDHTYEDAFSTQDFISGLEAKYHAEDYYFEQELMDLFRPDIEHDKDWGFRMFVELLFYSGMPESYSKTVHQMVLDEEEAERSTTQAGA